MTVSGPDLGERVIDAQDIGRFRGAVTDDGDTIRRRGIRIAYQLSLGHVEEYNDHRALAVLRDHDAAHDLPIIGDGSADPGDGDRTISE